ncbi:bifunctional DNA primase/polymerase [Mycolicibacterium fallax]|uniref:Uncharacterized protein n=1 Tax=Mycolicibacterium fallax TaxID=1793 RepID=A0A1X1R7T5_MYCFA|nr:bifunctional DNA primase/polymerase [Mycolicibacterium fallax]ORV00967.1 hypothetical protein AWC04_14945 [Mycolicibacterium fallax]BBZ00522.1 hypothetical protein MFAL_39880 [Mycolicibacterium fallax]
MTAQGSLNRALSLAQTRGWRTIPLLPYMKLPAVSEFYQRQTINPGELEVMWKEAQDRIASLTSRVAAGRVEDEDLADVVRSHPDYAELEPNIAVLLGHSRLVIVDVDTTDQMHAWLAFCERHGYDPGPRTQASPGVITREGTVKHDGMGHFFYALPDDIDGDELNRSGVSLPLGEPTVACETEEARKAAVPVLMTGKRYALIAPSTRAEGAYVPTAGTAIRPLPAFLAAPLREHLNSRRAQREKAQSRSAHLAREDRLWAWDDHTPWTDILEGWEETDVDGEGCVTLRHPDASSNRSAVAHAVGCSHLRNSDCDAPPPVTFFTSTLPDWVLSALETTENKQTVGKLKLYAHKLYGGDVRTARRMLGLADHAPTRARKASTSNAPSAGGWKTVQFVKQAPVKLNLPPRPVRARRTSDVEVVEPVVAAPTAATETIDPPKAEPEKTPAKKTPAKKPAVKKASAAPESYDPAWDSEFTDSVPEIQPWEPASLHDHAARFIASHAAPTTHEIWESIAAREVRLSEWAGKDSESEKWTDRDRERRQTRADLFAIRHLPITDLAEYLGVNPERARALARVLIPTAAQAGFVIRDRPRGDPLRYMVPPSKPEDSDLAIWKVQ